MLFAAFWYWPLLISGCLACRRTPSVSDGRQPPSRPECALSESAASRSLHALVGCGCPGGEEQQRQNYEVQDSRGDAQAGQLPVPPENPTAPYQARERAKNDDRSEQDGHATGSQIDSLGHEERRCEKQDCSKQLHITPNSQQYVWPEVSRKGVPVNEIVIFLAAGGWRGRRAGSCPVAAATTPDDLGCPCSAAPQSRPVASSCANATPRLDPPSAARPSAGL